MSLVDYQERETVQFFDVRLNLLPEIVAPLDGAELVPIAPAPTIEQIRQLEDVLRAGPTLDMSDMTSHHFAEGLYGRELFIPAGTVLTGKMHKRGQLNVLAQGDITVWTEQGMKRLQAPAVIPSGAGIKRVGYAHTDCVWITIHATHETDLVKLEEQLIEPEPVRAIESQGEG